MRKQGGKWFLGLCLAGWMLVGQPAAWADDPDMLDQQSDSADYTVSKLQVGGKHVKVYNAVQPPAEEGPAASAAPESAAPDEMPGPLSEEAAPRGGRPRGARIEPGAGGYEPTARQALNGEAWANGQPCEGGDCEECGGCWAPSCRARCQQFWVRNEYLHWFTNGTEIPPLVTTTLNPDAEVPGALDDPDTIILFGDDEILDGDRSGYRLTAGYWFDCCHTTGIQGDFFDLGTRALGTSFRSNGDPILSRPYIDISDPEEPIGGVELVALPGVLVGCDLKIDAEERFRGAGVDLRHNFCCESWCSRRMRTCDEYGCDQGGAPMNWGLRLDGIVGYRHYHLGSRITIRENLVVVDPQGIDPPGTLIDVTDQFGTTNDFHGVELGGIVELRRGPWALEALAKVALGNNRQSITIFGQTDVAVPGQELVQNVGGLYALNNIGRYTQDQYVAIPQVQLTASYALGCHLKLFAGYDFLYWADVIRAGEQVNIAINPNNLPPGDPPGSQPQPGTEPPGFFESNFWAHGFNVGVEYAF